MIYLKEFYTYVMGVYWRLYIFYVLRGLIPFFIFSKSTRLHAKLLFAVRSRVLNPSRVIYRKEIKSLADFLPDAKKKNHFFDILISDYPTHELVLNLKKNQNLNFTSLSKIHDWSLGHLYRYSFKVREIFGFILGSGAILLSTVPEPIVLKFLHTNHIR